MKAKSTLRTFLTLTATIALAVTTTYAAGYTWDTVSGDGAAITSGSGTWNTTAGNIVWNDAGADKIWAQTSATVGLHNAILAGASGTHTITVGTGVAATRLVFSTSGYTLSAATAQTVTISGSPVVQVDTGAEATIGANVTINATNSLTVGQGTATNLAGTLNVDGTSAVLRVSNNVPGLSFNGNGLTVNLKTGTIRNNTATTTTGAVIVASGLGSDVSMNVSGGTLSVSGNNGLIVGGTGKGTVTQTGGTVSIAATHTVVTDGSNTIGLTLGNNAANVSANTYNLNGGTLNTPTVRKGSGTDPNAAVFNFNGGLLVANNTATTTTNVTFMEGLSAAKVKAGGARIQNAQNITINQALLADSPSGGLTKTGAGTLTLGGANTYTGATAVEAGKLKLSTAGTSVSSVTVPDTASGGAFVAATDGQHVSTGNLSLSNDSALVIDYGATVPSSTVAPLQVVDFTLGTGIDLEIEGSTAPEAGPVYPLVKWTGTGPADASAFYPLTLPSGLVASFAVDVPNNTLTVTFAAPPPISWNTGNGTWDTTPGNTVWLNQTPASVAFVDNVNMVLFGDAPSAGANPVVTLDSALTPLGVTMNSTSRDYTISGSGGIGGVAGLTLDAGNTRTHSLATDNTYTGPTVVNGGTLSLGDGGASGSIAATSAITVATDATFAVNQSDTVTQGTDFGVIGGDGGFAQNGGSDMVAGTTVLNLANTFTGPISITKGNLEIGANGRLGGGAYAGSIDIVPAASVFQYGGSSNQTLSGIISGAGSLVKAGSSTLTLSGLNTYTGSTTVSQGVLSLGYLDALATTSGVTLGGASAATLSTSLTGITLTAPITTANTGVNSTIAFGRSATAAGTLTLDGVIGGPGNVIFSTPNEESANATQTIDLGAAGTYAGSTTITTLTTNNTLRVRNMSGAADALPPTTVLTMDGGNGPSGNFIRTVTYDLNDQNQTLAGLTNVARTKRNQRITNGGTGVPTLTINNSVDCTYGGSGASGTVSWSALIIGNLALTKTGTGTFVLNGSNSYTGDTTINQGILSLTAANASNDTSSVTIASGATLDLNFSGTDKVNRLVIGATQMANGVYGAEGSGAQFENAQITGTGTLTVVPGGYAGWAGTNADGQGPELDSDNDGVSNGVEYFMNAPAGFTANPQLNGSNTITWPNGGNIPASAYGTQFVVQTSPDLTTWTNVPIGNLTTNTSGPDGSLTYTLTGGSPRFVRLTVTPN